MMVAPPRTESLDYAQRAIQSNLWGAKPVVQARLLLNHAEVAFVLCSMTENSVISVDTITTGCEQFETDVNHIINDLYSSTLDKTVAEEAALAYVMRGDLYQLTAFSFDAEGEAHLRFPERLYAAIDEYKLATEIPDLIPRQYMYTYGYLGDCFYRLRQFEESQRYYELARALAQRMGPDFDDDEKLYTELRDMVTYEMFSATSPTLTPNSGNHTQARTLF